MPDAATTKRQARRLAAALEPCIGQVYFAPEAHAGYQALGFGPSPVSVASVAMPDGAAYFTSRGSLLGDVAPSVVASTFAVFNPAVVHPAVEYGQSLTAAAPIRAVRREAGAQQLERVLGAHAESDIARAADLLARAVAPLRPEGRGLFAGARYHYDESLDAWQRFFQLGDILREYRGDSHTAAWIVAGVDAVEISLVSELFLGLPARSYSRSRAWSDADFDAADERLRSRGWLGDDGQLTAVGTQEREAIELATDAQVCAAVEALGADYDPLLALLEPWGAAVRAAGGYPSSAAGIVGRG